MEKGYSKWRKLDNAALAFPLVTDKNDTRVFRFYCQLKEAVNSEILQCALDQNGEISVVPCSSAKGTVLVLSGAKGYRCICKRGKETTVQQPVYTG